MKITVPQFTAQFPTLALGLTSEEQASLLNALEMEDFSAGETLIVDGTPTDSLFLVWSGKLNVVIHTATGEHEVAVVGPGSMLGEVSILDPGPSTATVRTEQGCVVLSLGRKKLQELWREHPRVAAKFLATLTRGLASRIRQVTNELNRLDANMMGA
ncbi:MAG: CRP-like cAMP-binding protein [Kiritimatiellia bacterium]|jgi:CRP-like cAMP-binding protein